MEGCELDSHLEFRIFSALSSQANKTTAVGYISVPAEL